MGVSGSVMAAGRSRSAANANVERSARTCTAVELRMRHCGSATEAAGSCWNGTKPGRSNKTDAKSRPVTSIEESTQPARTSAYTAADCAGSTTSTAGSAALASVLPRSVCSSAT